MTLKTLIILLSAAAFAGCAQQNKQPPITPRGEVVAKGTGPLSFRAPERGMASVYDVNINTIVHASGLTPGSVLMTNPNVGNITINDAGVGGTQTVYQGLNKSHRYEIWFIPAQGGTTTRSAAAATY